MYELCGCFFFPFGRVCHSNGVWVFREPWCETKSTVCLVLRLIDKRAQDEPSCDMRTCIIRAIYKVSQSIRRKKFRAEDSWNSLWVTGNKLIEHFPPSPISFWFVCRYRKKIKRSLGNVYMFPWHFALITDPKKIMENVANSGFRVSASFILCWVIIILSDKRGLLRLVNLILWFPWQPLANSDEDEANRNCQVGSLLRTPWLQGYPPQMTSLRSW